LIIRGIQKRESINGSHTLLNFGIMIHKAGNAGLNSAVAGCIGDLMKIVKVVSPLLAMKLIETNRIKPPVDAPFIKSAAQTSQLPQPFRQGRHKGLKKQIRGIDGKIEKKRISFLNELVAVISSNKRTEILGPEDNAPHLVRIGRYAGYPAVVGILDFKHPAVHLFHEPFHVKSGNIGSARRRNDHGGIEIGPGMRYVAPNDDSLYFITGKSFYMNTSIQIKLFASLGRYMPNNSDRFPIGPGITVRALALHLGIPLESAKLIFVNGQKSDLSATLSGGERVAIFPPVGGG
jgi:hypothetical protein